MIFRDLSSGGIGEIIREAEKLIAEGRYNLALEQLHRARQREPKNAYITAIIERVGLLSTQEQPPSSTDIPEGDNDPRYLSVTVGPEFNGGIKEADLDEPSTPADCEARVKRLTGVAVDLFRHGSYDTAFDSLMKAYLLDPTSKYVIDCEHVLAPAIELMRRRAIAAGVPVPREVSPTSPEPATPVSSFAPSSQKRLEALLKQKEAERQAHERTVWREASRSSRPQTVQHSSNPGVSHKGPPPRPESSGSLFSKLRDGKFLD